MSEISQGRLLVALMYDVRNRFDDCESANQKNKQKRIGTEIEMLSNLVFKKIGQHSAKRTLPIW